MNSVVKLLWETESRYSLAAVSWMCCDASVRGCGSIFTCSRRWDVLCRFCASQYSLAAAAEMCCDASVRVCESIFTCSNRWDVLWSCCASLQVDIHLWQPLGCVVKLLCESASRYSIAAAAGMCCEASVCKTACRYSLAAAAGMCCGASVQVCEAIFTCSSRWDVLWSFCASLRVDIHLQQPLGCVVKLLCESASRYSLAEAVDL